MQNFKSLDLCIEHAKKQSHEYIWGTGPVCNTNGEYHSISNHEEFVVYLKHILLPSQTTEIKSSDDLILPEEYYTCTYIPDGSKSMFYLDLDSPKDTILTHDYIKSFYDNMPNLLIKLDSIIKELLKDYMFDTDIEKALSQREVTTYKSEAAIENKKISIHVHYPMLKCDNKTSKWLATLLKNGPDETISSLVDLNVYHNKQRFRFPFCSKQNKGGKGASPPLYPYPAISSDILPKKIDQILRVSTLVPLKDAVDLDISKGGCALETPKRRKITITENPTFDTNLENKAVNSTGLHPPQQRESKSLSSLVECTSEHMSERTSTVEWDENPFGPQLEAEDIIWPSKLISTSTLIIQDILRQKWNDTKSQVVHVKEDLFRLARQSTGRCVFGVEHDRNNGYCNIGMDSISFGCTSETCKNKVAKVDITKHKLRRDFIVLDNKDLNMQKSTFELIEHHFRPRLESLREEYMQEKEERKKSKKRKSMESNIVPRVIHEVLQWQFAIMRYINRFYKSCRSEKPFNIVLSYEKRPDGTTKRLITVVARKHLLEQHPNLSFSYPLYVPSQKKGPFIIQQTTPGKFYKGVGTKPIIFQESYQDVYDGIEFYPLSEMDDKRSPSEKKNKFNLFDEFAITRNMAAEWVKRNPKQYQEDVEVWKNHIYNHMCCDKGQPCRPAGDYCMKLLADVLQNPHIKKEVALIIRGGQGTGKSLFQKKYREIFGESYGLEIKTIDDLQKGFNKFLERALVVVGEEAIFHGDIKAFNQLKAMLTTREIKIEPKGVDAYTVKSFVFLLCVSNAELVAPISFGERRFFVAETSDRFAGRKNQMESKEYFRRFRDINPHAIAHYLYELDLTGFEHREIPITHTLVEQQKLASYKTQPLYAFWKAVAEDHVIGFCEEEELVIDEKGISHTKPRVKRSIYKDSGLNTPTTITKQMFFDGFYHEWAKIHTPRSKIESMAAFMKGTHKMLGNHPLEPKRKLVDSTKRMGKSYMVFPAREYLEAALKSYVARQGNIC